MASLLTSFTATANTADPDPSNLGRDDMNTVTGTLHGGDSVNTKATTSAHSDANVPTDASALSEEGTVGSIDAVARKVSEPKAAGRGTESDPKKAARYIALLGKMGGLEAIEVSLLEISRERLYKYPAEFLCRFARAKKARVQEVRRLASLSCASRNHVD